MANTKKAENTKVTNVKQAPGDTVETTNAKGEKVLVPTDEAMQAAGMKTLSSRIRHLESLGIATAQITKVVKRENGAHPLYQHVRNVLQTPLKTGFDLSLIHI